MKFRIVLKEKKLVSNANIRFDKFYVIEKQYKNIFGKSKFQELTYFSGEFDETHKFERVSQAVCFMKNYLRECDLKIIKEFEVNQN